MTDPIIIRLGGAIGCPWVIDYHNLNIGKVSVVYFCWDPRIEKDEAECQRIVEKINACEPDILFVGLGAPKQEFWMAKYQSQIKIGIMLGIGAAIAFAAGVEKRAPVFMQKTGLEWFYRLIHDPRRLTRRYLKDFAFFKIVWRQKRQHFSS